MKKSRDYNELKYAWKGWYEAAGRPIKDQYEEFVALSNKASKGDGKYRKPISIFLTIFDITASCCKVSPSLPILNFLDFSSSCTKLLFLPTVDCFIFQNKGKCLVHKVAVSSLFAMTK